jgi:hypothetical protein
MADWRQIQARIRKAKASGLDAAAKLAELYERTRDAMVAFELAQWHEKAGEHAEAARWYTAAAERFRRSQWRSKAEAALARLGAPAPAPAAADSLQEGDTPTDAQEKEIGPSVTPRVPRRDAPSANFQTPSSAFEAQRESESEMSAEATSEQPHGNPVEDLGMATTEEPPSEPGRRAQTGEKRPRRRGRRGGRSRRPSGTAASSSLPQPQAAVGEVPPAKPAAVASFPSRSIPEAHATPSPPETLSVPGVTSWQGRSRAGEPALASRIAQLESQLRRLLACPQAQLAQADSAPAGPGVLLLSDSDQVTHYYIESCQTLRIAIGNLVRGGRPAKEAPRLKEHLAENLGIAEARVPNYLKEHCAVRWLQLDEGATELAHFAIAVLRPVVNE